MTVNVKREMQTTRPALAVMRIDQICVVRPSAAALAVAATKPSPYGHRTGVGNGLVSCECDSLFLLRIQAARLVA